MKLRSKLLGAAAALSVLLAGNLAWADTFSLSDLVSNANVLVSQQILGSAPTTADFSSLTYTNATILPTNANWVSPSLIGSGASWITNGSEGLDYSDDSWLVFKVSFTIPDQAYNIQTTPLIFSADNAVQVYLNNALLGSVAPVEGQGQSVDRQAYGYTHTLDLPTLQSGVYELTFVVQNYYQAGGSSSSNPTAVVFATGGSYETGEGGNTPEPGSMLLLGSAMGAAFFARRRRNGGLGKAA